MEPGNITHIGYIGNSCLKLDLDDIALTNYQHASELAADSQSWLLSNIGNILNNKGFYSESIKYLKKGIELDSGSEYAHNRLASALKMKEEEKKKYKSLIKEGNQMLKEYGATLKLDS